MNKKELPCPHDNAYRHRVIHTHRERERERQPSFYSYSHFILFLKEVFYMSSKDDFMFSKRINLLKTSSGKKL